MSTFKLPNWHYEERGPHGWVRIECVGGVLKVGIGSPALNKLMRGKKKGGGGGEMNLIESSHGAQMNEEFKRLLEQPIVETASLDGEAQAMVDRHMQARAEAGKMSEEFAGLTDLINAIAILVQYNDGSGVAWSKKNLKLVNWAHKALAVHVEALIHEQEKVE